MCVCAIDFDVLWLENAVLPIRLNTMYVRASARVRASCIAGRRQAARSGGPERKSVCAVIERFLSKMILKNEGVNVEARKKHGSGAFGDFYGASLLGASNVTSWSQSNSRADIVRVLRGRRSSRSSRRENKHR